MDISGTYASVGWNWTKTTAITQKRRLLSLEEVITVVECLLVVVNMFEVSLLGFSTRRRNVRI